MSYRARIVVPCYNEALRLDVAALRDFVARAPDIAFTLVDDGSSDDTWSLISALAAELPGVDGLRLARNAGKAEAVRRGVLHALDLQDAPVVGYWDADFSTPLQTILDMAAELEAHPDLMMLMASRVQLLGRTIERHALRHYAGRFVATAAAAVLGLRVYDTQCGAKLMRASPALAACFARPFLTRWMFDVELIARVVDRQGQAAAGSRIREYPIPSWRDVAGSKISTRAGLRALFDLVRIRRHYFAARSRP
jgi:glycosyltransferase involved in cell wall biosynthesis